MRNLKLLDITKRLFINNLITIIKIHFIDSHHHLF